MTWWRPLAVLLCIVTALVSSQDASASSGVQAENRVGGFDLVAPALVGLHALRGAEKHSGNSVAYDEMPSGYSLAAEETSTALSAIRQTAEGEQFFHYGYAEQAAGFEGGMRAGGYATTVPGLSGDAAQAGLALPHANPPNAMYTVTPGAGTWIRANPTAAGLFGQPGGLPEVQFLYGTSPGTVSFPIPLPW